MSYAYASFENRFECTLIGFSYRSEKELERKIEKAKKDGWEYDGIYRPLTVVSHIPPYVIIKY